MTLRQCEGYTLTGQKCRKKIPAEQRYCTIHNRAVEIGIPPYVNITPKDNFWLFVPMGQPRWRVGSSATTIFKCLLTKHSYSLDKYVSEGTYGVVYFATDRETKTQVAIKATKEIFHKYDPVEYDFYKEYIMHNVIRDRVQGGSEYIVNMIEAFFIKTVSGLHGCIAMEMMDGDLDNLFDRFASIKHI